MPHLCVVGGCSNGAHEGVSIHKWPKCKLLRKKWDNFAKQSELTVSQADHIVTHLGRFQPHGYDYYVIDTYINLILIYVLPISMREWT